MAKMTKKNADEVLERIGDLIRNDKDAAKILLYQMNEMLDGLLGADFFGTEGQLDPRGDRRNEET